jgi:hypothetical protein
MTKYSHEGFDEFEGTMIVRRETEDPQVGHPAFCQREISDPLTTTRRLRSETENAQYKNDFTAMSCRANVARSW